MLKNFSYEVKTQSYSSQVSHFGDDLIVMNRIQNYTETATPIDAYGPVWIVGLSSLNNRILVKDGSKFIKLVGPCGFLAPPFSILKWEILPGRLEWTALASNEILPGSFNNQPFIFEWNGVVPDNLRGLLDLVSSTGVKKIIEMQTVKSSSAEKIKEIIDSTYKENIVIGEIAKTLGLSQAYTCREFKRAYELSPVEYRHKVRLFDAIKSLSMGIPVTEACLNSGFSSINQFNLHFKNYMGTTPLRYSADKNPTKRPLVKARV